jgi:hypothetical protein
MTSSAARRCSQRDVHSAETPCGDRRARRPVMSSSSVSVPASKNLHQFFVVLGHYLDQVSRVPSTAPPSRPVSRLRNLPVSGVGKERLLRHEIDHALEVLLRRWAVESVHRAIAQFVKRRQGARRPRARDRGGSDHQPRQAGSPAPKPSSGPSRRRPRPPRRSPRRRPAARRAPRSGSRRSWCQSG